MEKSSFFPYNKTKNIGFVDIIYYNKHRSALQCIRIFLPLWAEKLPVYSKKE